MKKHIAVNASRYPTMAFIYEVDSDLEKVKAVVCSANENVDNMNPRWYSSIKY